LWQITVVSMSAPDLPGPDGPDGKNNQDQNSEDREKPSYVVGVGASAGGLEALELMFQALSSDSGMAFVIVQHLSPDFKSLMDELLARYTDMAIHRVEDGMRVERNSLYLIPPKQEMIISDGKLLLTEKDSSQALSLPIDHFLRSLAQDVGSRSIAVVLSGTGSDGSRGIRDIHAAGGLVIAQRPESAKFDGMPRSAIDTGLADVVVEPAEIADILTRYAAHPVRSQLGRDRAVPVDETSLEHIFRLLQRRYGIDFNSYKPTTIGRRIERRIQLNHDGDLEEYVRRLENDSGELDRLYKDLLIGVTSFFRDQEAFDELARDVISQMLLSHDDGEEFRVWVAACGTGEEAYSIAILIDECMRVMNRTFGVKIFATDVHQSSLDFAHAGVYPETSLENMSVARRQKYFVRTDAGYQVMPEIRRMIVFAPHNLVKDAPFTHLHLITCRNLLIYLQPLAQKKVLSLFHFGLKPNGYVFLGASESPGDLAEEFETLSERWKIYRKRRDVRLTTDFRGNFSHQTLVARETLPSGPLRPSIARDRDLISTYDDLLDEYMPISILVGENQEVVQMFGGAGKYLRMHDGRISTSVLDLVAGDLKLALAGALQRVSKSGETVTCSRVRVPMDAGEKHVRLTVRPVGKHGGGHKNLITFEELDPPEPVEVGESQALDLDEVSRSRVKELEQELRYSKENLQAAIEELETSNEELQATNEELVASNEELQSTNEELHSVNEELYTVNAEYQRKIGELTELTNDMDSLLTSTRVHTLFLDTNFCIRKFTPDIAPVFNLIASDVGRRIHGFTHKLACNDLLEKLNGVIERCEEHEEEIQDHDGHHFLMRILPYFSESTCQGAVLTLIDVTRIKTAEQELRNSETSLERERTRLRTILDQAPCIIYLKDLEGRYLELNQFGLAHYSQTREGVIGRTDPELLGPAGEDSHASDLRVIATGERFAGEFKITTACGTRVFHALKSPLRNAEGRILGTCGVGLDITDRKEAESALANEIANRDQFLAMLSHELRNPIGAVLNALQVLESESPDGTTDNEAQRVIYRQTHHMARLLDDLLDVARIGQAKIEFRRKVVDLCSLAADVLESVRHELNARQQEINTSICQEPLMVYADPARVKQAQVNLLSNASTYTPAKGEIWYALKKVDDTAVVTVRDSGEGIPHHLLNSIFDLFVQADSSLAHSSGGMGVGLSLTRSIVEAHDGQVSAESAGAGQGSTFRIQLPLTDQPVEREVPAPHFAFHGCKVLMVEDNDDARTMLARALKLKGFEVAEASDGYAALQAIRSFRPTVAIIDIGLPGMDGYQLAREVRGDEEICRTILIALTGYGRSADRDASEKAGFDAHLVKPLDPNELYALIETLQSRVADK
jgi:two-component system CheB/CheR fusion protein